MSAPTARTRRLTALLVGACLLVFPLAVGAGAQQATTHGYTFLGRGFAAVVAYPADEIPSTGDDEEEPAEPPPDQTCPEGARGVDEATAARLAAVGDTTGIAPIGANVDDEDPTPRGQPIKFDIGMSDTSLRSDPGSHAIAAFLYVDLGGSQDEWSSVETDGYANAHVREQERCARPFAGAAGTANDVHVIAVAIEGPYAYAFNRTRRTEIGPAAFLDSSITESRSDGRGEVVRSRTIAIAEGIDIGGQVRADEVTTVIDVVTDGTEAGTELRAWTLASGVVVGGQPVDLEPGGPPVTAGTLSVTLATPQVRVLADGTVEVSAGGMLVGGRADNPVGLQAKQSFSIAAAQLTYATSRIPAPPVNSFAGGEAATPTPNASEPSVFSPFPPTRSGPQPARTLVVPATATDPPPVPGPVIAGAPTALGTVRRLGVFRETPTDVGVIAVLATTALLVLGIALVFARARSWRFRALLGARGLRALDRGYRAFVRG